MMLLFSEEELGVRIGGPGFENLHKKRSPQFFEDFSCDPPGARTQDPNIKSVVLYQLS